MKLSLRGVARAAGVSQTAPYHHFADKEALLAAVAETGFADLVREMEAQSEGITGSGAIMVALGLGYVTFATANPGRFRLMFGPLIRDKLTYHELIETSSGSYQMIRDGVAARRAEVQSKTGNLEADTMAAWSVVHGLATLLIDAGFNSISMGADDQRGLIEYVTGALINGLGMEPR